MTLLPVWLPKCLQWPFCPGVFIAILAFLTAAVAFRRDPKPHEKAFWIIVFLGLMCAEVWMVSQDRNAHDDADEKTRTTEREHFESTAKGIKDEIQLSTDQFAATVKHFDATLFMLQKVAGLSQEARDRMTGGDQFCYVTALSPASPFVPHTQPNWPLYVFNSGEYVLPSCTLTIVPYPDDPAHPKPEDVVLPAVRQLTQVQPKSKAGHYAGFALPPHHLYEIRIDTPMNIFSEALYFNPDSNRTGYRIDCSVSRVRDKKVVLPLGSGCSLPPQAKPGRS